MTRTERVVVKALEYAHAAHRVEAKNEPLRKLIQYLAGVKQAEKAADEAAREEWR